LKETRQHTDILHFTIQKLFPKKLFFSFLQDLLGIGEYRESPAGLPRWSDNIKCISRPCQSQAKPYQTHTNRCLLWVFNSWNHTI